METKNGEMMPTMETENSALKNSDSSSAMKPAKQAENHGGVIATWDKDAKAVRTTLDMTKPRERALISQCLDQADKKIVQAAGSVYEIEHFFAHVVDLAEEETGEIVAKIRLVMVTKDGTKISTVSKPFIDNFSNIMQMMGPKPWAENPLIKINLRKGSKGHDYATCHEVVREIEEVITPSKPSKAR